LKNDTGARDRLSFLAERHRTAAPALARIDAAIGAATRPGAPPIDWDRVRHRFLGGCVAALTDVVAARAEFEAVRPMLRAACDAAVATLRAVSPAQGGAALDNGLRRVEHLAAPLADAHGVLGWAARVPSRAVWAACMAALVPDEEATAVLMLINDLAAVGGDLPGTALAAAVEAETDRAG
jgi:hypothetical protein